MKSIISYDSIKNVLVLWDVLVSNQFTWSLFHLIDHYGQLMFPASRLIDWYLNIRSLPGEGVMNNFIIWSFPQSSLYCVLVPFIQVVFSSENQE